jgi:SAM-dependent methyltransferase
MTAQTSTRTAPAVDVIELEAKVKEIYRQVAEAPHGRYHFELGRPLAERLGYDPAVLDGIPEAAVASFAGVGCVFGLAQLRPGERVADLGSGSGMDAWYAASQVGPEGYVLGVDFTPQQVARAMGLVAERAVGNIDLREGRIESIPAEDAAFDCVISNGVVNLSPEKPRVFAEVARLLRPGGRLAIADIVSDVPLKESIVRDADLWASCIGGAVQLDDYQQIIESAGLTVTAMGRNPYQFLSRRAQSASATYGVRSLTVLAVKPE